MQLRLLSTRTHLDEIERIWHTLTADGAPSYFLSWGWMGTWLRSLPADVNMQLAVFEDSGTPVMAAMLGHANVTRRHVFRSKAYLLNETGDRRYDQVYVECNAFLNRLRAPVRLDELVKLLPSEWDEICFSGMDPELFPGSALNQEVRGCKLYMVNRMPSPYVDLEAIGHKKGDYLALLSSNARSQIRRAYKLYQQRGAMQTDAAADAATAMKFYEEMKDLHEKAWRAKGDSGAFANPWFDQFHQTLIRERFAHGEIQLIRVAFGGEPIGLIYNFVFEGRVYYYQAGFRYEEDNKLKPGYVAHCEAIQYNYRQGNRRYEFLGGYEDFKLRLSTNIAELVWARLQKPRLKFAIENFARAAALWAVDKYESRGGRKSGRRLAAEALRG